MLRARGDWAQELLGRLTQFVLDCEPRLGLSEPVREQDAQSGNTIRRIREPDSRRAAPREASSGSTGRRSIRFMAGMSEA